MFYFQVRALHIGNDVTVTLWCGVRSRTKKGLRSAASQRLNGLRLWLSSTSTIAEADYALESMQYRHAVTSLSAWFMFLVKGGELLFS
jgi:hypothetical protein